MFDDIPYHEPQSEDEILDSITVRPEESASQPAHIVGRNQHPDDSESALSIASSATVVSNATYSGIAGAKSRSRRSHVWDKENGMEYRDEKGKLRWRCQRCMTSF
jgi:hypothetical protein